MSAPTHGEETKPQRVMPEVNGGPSVSALHSARTPSSPHQSSVRIQVVSMYNWTIWVLLTSILFAQFFGVIWSSVTSESHLLWGRNPLTGKYAIPGFNDEPYSDRAVACVKRGHYYHPIQLSQLLKEQDSASPKKSADYRSNGMDGYRVVSRDSYSMDAAKFPFYQRQCTAIMLTLESIFGACESLGYNVTRDVLRVVDGVDSNVVTVLTSTLPVLIVPFWDIGALSRYVVPGHDGNACVFRGSGVFENEKDTSAVMSAVNRSVREGKTAEWLGYPGGVWRNGWYEDPVVNMRWYSDVISSSHQGKYGIGGRQFDLIDAGRELECSRSLQGCGSALSRWVWNDQLCLEVGIYWFHSVAISNGSRFGLFLFDALSTDTIKSRYSLEKLISNVSFAVLLSQWFVAMIALAPHDTICIGAIADTRAFYLLPIFLYPRFKAALEGFWSSGCHFEGDERVLADAWFEVYPAIGEIVLIYFSLLNTLAKLLRRRVSDVLFGPTLLFFALLHFFRAEIAAANFLEFDKRISTAITADEVAASTLVDLLFGDVAFRMNGKIKSLYGTKIAVLVLNLVAMVFLSRRVSDDQSGLEYLRVETALAKRFVGNAGLGSTKLPYVQSRSGEAMTLRPYELVRGGYLAVGSRSAVVERKANGALLSMSDWFWLLITTPFRHASGLVLRVTVYDLISRANGGFVECTKPRVASVDDNQFDDVLAWKLSAPCIG